MPGPVPNRSDDLSRERDANRAHRAPITTGQLMPVTIPRVDSDWHPAAKRWFNSLKSSGQVEFFQNSDWAYAHWVATEMSHYMKSAKRSSMMYAALDSSMSKLLTTEADRRRARVELSAPEEENEPAAVLAIADYRKDLGLDS